MRLPTADAEHDTRGNSAQSTCKIQLLPWGYASRQGGGRGASAAPPCRCTQTWACARCSICRNNAFEHKEGRCKLNTGRSRRCCGHHMSGVGMPCPAGSDTSSSALVAWMRAPPLPHSRPSALRSSSCWRVRAGRRPRTSLAALRVVSRKRASDLPRSCSRHCYQSWHTQCSALSAQADIPPSPAQPALPPGADCRR